MSTLVEIDDKAAQTGSETHRHGCLFAVRRVLKWSGIVLVALIVLGAVYQVVATELDRRAFTPPGQLYDVDGYQMHLYCLGEGSPTVIFENGEGPGSVLRGITKSTCSSIPFDLSSAW